MCWPIFNSPLARFSSFSSVEGEDIFERLLIKIFRCRLTKPKLKPTFVRSLPKQRNGSPKLFIASVIWVSHYHSHESDKDSAYSSTADVYNNKRLDDSDRNSPEKLSTRKSNQTAIEQANSGECWCPDRWQTERKKKLAINWKLMGDECEWTSWGRARH